MGGLLTLLIFAVISLAPLVAATFVGGRLGRRGLWQIMPWAGLVGLGLLLGVAFHALADRGQVTSTDPDAFPAIYGAWAGSLLISGYVSTLVYLIVLASAGPARSRTAAAEMF